MQQQHQDRICKWAMVAHINPKDTDAFHLLDAAYDLLIMAPDMWTDHKVATSFVPLVINGVVQRKNGKPRFRPATFDIWPKPVSVAIDMCHQWMAAHAKATKGYREVQTIATYLLDMERRGRDNVDPAFMRDNVRDMAYRTIA